MSEAPWLSCNSDEYKRLRVGAIIGTCFVVVGEPISLAILAVLTFLAGIPLFFGWRVFQHQKARESAVSSARMLHALNRWLFRFPATELAVCVLVGNEPRRRVLVGLHCGDWTQAAAGAGDHAAQSPFDLHSALDFRCEFSVQACDPLWCVSVLIVLSVMLQLVWKPYKQRVDNVAELILLIAALSSYQVGILVGSVQDFVHLSQAMVRLYSKSASFIMLKLFSADSGSCDESAASAVRNHARCAASSAQDRRGQTRQVFMI